MDGTVIYLRFIRRISYPSFVQPAPGLVIQRTRVRFPDFNFICWITSHLPNSAICRIKCRFRYSVHGWHCYIFNTYPPDKLSKLRTTGPRSSNPDHAGSIPSRKALELHFSQLVPVGPYNVYLNDISMIKTVKMCRVFLQSYSEFLIWLVGFSWITSQIWKT